MPLKNILLCLLGAPLVLTSVSQSLSAAAPEIAIQQPTGSDLVDGKSKRSFGSVKVGKESPSKTFTIKNKGTANLSGLAITVIGLHSGDFTVTNPGFASVPAGKSMTFKLVFKPRAKGTRTATIRVMSNDRDENPFDIKITGAGTAK